MNIISAIGVILLVLKLVGVSVAISYFWIWNIILWPLAFVLWMIVVAVVGAIVMTCMQVILEKMGMC